MEHERETFPLKATAITPASRGFLDEIKTRNADASRVGQRGIFPRETEIARYTPHRAGMLPEIQTMTPSHMEQLPRLHAALPGEMVTACFADRYEPPEDAIPAHVETKKRIRVPQIQSMDDYIKRHYARELMTGMLEDIGWRTDKGGAIQEVYDDTFHIGRMSFWRRSRTELIARIKMWLDACGDKSDQIDRYEYAAEMYFDFTDEIEYKEISYRPFNRCLEESVESEYNDSMWLLDNHLVPYAKKETIEKRAWEMHCDFFQEERCAAMSDQFPEDAAAAGTPDKQNAEQRRIDRRAAIMHEYSAFELARRMGLGVISVALYKKNRRKSFFNFRESQVQVLQEGPDGKKREPVWITVPADTIVINTLRHEPNDGEMSVFHECIHWYWHYLFYRLQALHNSDISALQKDHELEPNKNGVKESLSCMEYQANRGKGTCQEKRTPKIEVIYGKLAPSAKKERRTETAVCAPCPPGVNTGGCVCHTTPKRRSRFAILAPEADPRGRGAH